MPYGQHPRHKSKTHNFATIPNVSVRRSSFTRNQSYKTTIARAGTLIPFYTDEVLPGDTFNVRVNAFTRMAPLINPIMDELYMDFHYFFVPNRLVWDNWQKFMGEQENPGDSIDYLIPKLAIYPRPISGTTISDYFGIPPVMHDDNRVGRVQIADVSALYHRAYHLIWNEWFRDENLQRPIPISKGDGPDHLTGIFTTGALGGILQSGLTYGISTGTTENDVRRDISSQSLLRNPGNPIQVGFSNNDRDLVKVKDAFSSFAEDDPRYLPPTDADGRREVTDFPYLQVGDFLYSDRPLPRGKRHDYFTSCLPWPQKGQEITLPIGGQAFLKSVNSGEYGRYLEYLNSKYYGGPEFPVPPRNGDGASNFIPLSAAANTGQTNMRIYQTFNTRSQSAAEFINKASSTPQPWIVDVAGTKAYNSYNQTSNPYDPYGRFEADFQAGREGEVLSLGLDGRRVYADLSEAVAPTINAMRLAFQQQKFLEKDARGGTRYIEILKSHFGVTSPDARLQRPEYLGGASTPVNITPVAQTAPPTGKSDYGSTLGNLGAVGFSAIDGRSNGFVKSFVEHGMVIGLVSYRANQTYQYGLHKRFTRRTRFDYYFPVFAHLGEQAVLRGELFMSKDREFNEQVFGYQERWSEYRYGQSLVTGLFRSDISAIGASPLKGDGPGQAKTPTKNGVLQGKASGEDNIGYQRISLSTWHLAQEMVQDRLFTHIADFGQLNYFQDKIAKGWRSDIVEPYLSSDFIREDPPLVRILVSDPEFNRVFGYNTLQEDEDFTEGSNRIAPYTIHDKIGPEVAGQQVAASNGYSFIFDAKLDIICSRPMPMYSVPGNIDRF